MKINRLLLLGLTFISTIFGYQAVQREVSKQVRIQMRLNGPHPKTVTIEEGTVEFMFENRVFAKQLDFQLDDERGLGIARTSNPSNKLKGRQRMPALLRPGRHQLRVVDVPEWKVDVVVVPKGGK